MYEFDAPGTIRSQEEYLQCDLDITDVDPSPARGLISAPLLVGQEAIAPNVQRSGRLVSKHNISRDELGLPAAKPRRVTLCVGPEPRRSPSRGGGRPTACGAGRLCTARVCGRAWRVGVTNHPVSSALC